jgi:hypothetical protein
LGTGFSRIAPVVLDIACVLGDAIDMFLLLFGIRVILTSILPLDATSAGINGVGNGQFLRHLSMKPGPNQLLFPRPNEFPDRNKDNVVGLYTRN